MLMSMFGKIKKNNMLSTGTPQTICTEIVEEKYIAVYGTHIYLS